jgi:hypothetical protein
MEYLDGTLQQRYYKAYAVLELTELRRKIQVGFEIDVPRPYIEMPFQEGRQPLLASSSEVLIKRTV